MTGRLVLTAAEAAEVLGVSRSTITKMVARGDLPRVDLGDVRCLRIPAQAIEELLNRRIVQAQAAGRRLKAVVA